MEALNQYFDVVKTWTDVQVKTGQGWMEAMQGLEQFAPDQIFSKTIEAYQASVQSTLDAEVSGSKVLFDGLEAVEGLPQPALELVAQYRGVTEQIIGVQQAFVDNCFKLAGQIEVPALSAAS